MRKLLLLIVLLRIGVSANAQQNYLLKIDALNERIKNGGDTVFVVNFWATWCGPCVNELPNFEKLNNTYGKEKLKVLLVSVDFRSQFEKKVIPFIKVRKYKTTFFMLDEKNQQDYINKIDESWSGAIPATIFIKGSHRKFNEQEFTYKELSDEYLNFKQL